MADPESVDWHAVPGYPRFYRPEVVASSLRRLADATGAVAAAEAASYLGSGGLIHGHSGAVMPAAAVAAPILLDIVEHGHPVAKEGACRLLEESMWLTPVDGYTRVSVSFGPSVPLCCAVAHHIHARRDAITGLRRLGRSLLHEAAEHWLFEVGELADDGPDTVASGTACGTIPDGRLEAECHTLDGHFLLSDVRLEYPTVRGDSAASLRLSGIRPQAVPAHAVLLSTECGRRVH